MRVPEERMGSEDITPFDIERFLALMEHPEVKAAIFKLIDEREEGKSRIAKQLIDNRPTARYVRGLTKGSERNAKR